MSADLPIRRRSELEDADCLFRWRAIWQQGIADESEASLRGQAIHHIHYLYLRNLLARGLPADAEEADAAFVQGIAEHQTPLRLVPELQRIWRWYTETFELDLDHYLTHEERQEGEGRAFTPDLVYAYPGALEIIDIKSFWVVWTEAQVRQSYQGRFYTRAAMERWPHFPRYRFTMSFLRFNQRVTVEYTPAELDQVEIESKAREARIEEAERTQSWPATAGPACDYCTLADCPIATAPRTFPVRLTPIQAPDLAAWVTAHSKQVAAAKKLLKGFTDVHGPLTVDGLQWGSWPAQENRYPVWAVIQLLQASGQFGAFEDEALTISQSALAPILKRVPALLDDLAAIRQEKTVYRFGSKKAGAGGDGEAGDG